MPNEATTSEAPVAPAAATEAAPVVTTPAEASTAQPASTEIDTDTALDGLSYEDLERVLLAPSSVERKETAPAPAPAAAAPTPAETEEADDDTQEALPKNFRFHTEDPKLSNYLRTLKAAQKANPNVNPIEVARMVGYDGGSAPQAAAPAAAPAVETPAAPDPGIQTLRDRIAELDDLIKQESEVNYDHAKALRLAMERTEKIGELKDLQIDLAAQAEAQAEYNAGYQAAREKAWELCPASKDASSIQFDLIQGEVLKISREDPAAISRPDFPLFVLDRVAKRHPSHFGKAPAVAPTPAATPAAQPAPPLNRSRPVGAVVSGNASAPPVTTQDAMSQLDNLTYEQLETLANSPGVGTTRESLRRKF
jgi:hypothetical protein